MPMKAGGVNEIGTRPGVSLGDVLTQVFIYYLSKQTNKKTLEKSLECIFEARIVNFYFIRNMAGEDWLCCNSASRQRLRL